MKLKLTKEKDVAILGVLEEVSPANVVVLRAGIANLLKSGRNKIVVNVAAAQSLQLEVIRELAKLHGLAGELGGEVMLVGQGELVSEAARAEPGSISIRFFPTVELALTAMAELGAAANADHAAGGDPLGKLRAQLAKVEAEHKAVKAQVSRLDNADELRKLRYENGVFARQLAAVEEQLAQLKREHKTPFHANEAAERRQLLLEKALAAFLKTEGLLPNG
ncbi:MAG: hypothetical protein HY075_16765 [Deltaproteobacteria bacterium]|nr:hypothetical protein [Deltaproteobacteria bacterium]